MSLPESTPILALNHGLSFAELFTPEGLQKIDGLFLERLRAGHPGARVVALAGEPSYAGVDPLDVVPGLGELPGLRVPISRESLLKTVHDVRA